MKKIIIALFLITLLHFNYVFSTTYLYDKKEEKNKVIETMENLDFSFESEAQILMEPITGKIIYENNADEELLPASVTKV